MASNFWNELELKPPPTLTCEMNSTDVSLADLRIISDVCWDAVTLLKNQDTLFSEAATLSRLIYRMKVVFRGDKGLKSMKKVNQCLRHFLSLNIACIYDNFSRTIPWACSEMKIYCPTRQMLEHVLVRTQGLAALLCRIVHTCLEAACFLQSRISTGHNWPISLLCLGVVSRIWALAKHILEACVKWYGVMLPFLNKFQVKGASWLPDGYVYPSDLAKWLVIPHMDMDEVVNESEISSFSENRINSKNSTNGGALSSNHFNPIIMSIHDDVGVSLSREAFQRPFVVSQDASTPIDDMQFCKKKMKESSKKLKRKKKAQESKLVDKQTEEVTFESENVVCSNNQENAIRKGEETNSSKGSKTINIGEAISSIKSQIDVQRLLDGESKKRNLTKSLNEKQWLLLKNFVAKLNLKLKKNQDENKKLKILEQIRKALGISLL